MITQQQEFQFGDGDKQTVAQYLASQSKDLKIVAYQRFTLCLLYTSLSLSR